MIDELKQELLVDYLLNELDPALAERVRAEISADPELRDFVRETEEAYASIALTIPRIPAPAGPGRDYQLWVIDPKIPQPVSAGVFNVSNNGPMRTDFWPRSPVQSASAFAISLEKAGGAPKPEGEIILAGN